MVHSFLDPQLFPLHQLRNPKQNLYYLISSDKLPHILYRIWVLLKHLCLLISLSYLSPLEDLLLGYLTLVSVTI